MNKIRPATEKLRDSWWSKRGLDAILAARKEADHMNFSINLIIVIILFAAFLGSHRLSYLSPYKGAEKVYTLRAGEA